MSRLRLLPCSTHFTGCTELTSELPLGSLCWRCSTWALFWGLGMDFSFCPFSFFWFVGFSLINYYTNMDHTIQPAFKHDLFANCIKNTFPYKTYKYFYIIMSVFLYFSITWMFFLAFKLSIFSRHLYCLFPFPVASKMNVPCVYIIHMWLNK